MMFLQQTECKFKRVAPGLYDSGNGLILIVKTVSSRKYIYINHKESNKPIMSFANKPVIQLRFCFSALQYFLSRFNFDMSYDEIIKECDANKSLKMEIDVQTWDLIKEISIKD